MKPLIAISSTLLAVSALDYAPAGREQPFYGSAETSTLAVASLNMAKEADPQRVLRDIQASPRLRAADVLLLQEVVNGAGKPSVAEEIAARLGYFAAFAPATTTVHDQGLAIVSRYPLYEATTLPLKACDLRFRSRTRFALAVNVSTPWADVRVWNAHLDTRINPEERLQQLAPLLEEASRKPGPRLIGGDFNSNDFYWLGNVLPFPARSQGSAVRRAMERYGFRTPFADGATTFPLFNQHLDWIFVNQLHPIASSIEPVPFSDHHGIWTRVRIGS